MIKSLTPAAEIQDLESKGRHGDSTLVHMNPKEIELLEAIMGKKMTINPTTGLYEAFSWWKVLLGAAGIAAGIFTAGGAAALLPLFGGLSTAGAAAASAAVGGVGASLFGSGLAPSAPSASDAQKQLDAINAKNRVNQYNFATTGNRPVPIYNPAPPSVIGKENPYFNTAVDPLNVPPGNSGVVGKAAGGALEPEEKKAAQIVAEAQLAIMGRGVNPEGALNEFVKHFGKDALMQLFAAIKGGAGGMQGRGMPPQGSPTGGAMPMPAGIQGTAAGLPGGAIKAAGNGMDDMGAARMADGRKVLLSNDEYIVPADVVSHLGDGSSEAGIRQLDAMLDRVRKTKTGRVIQPGKIDHSKVMPA